MTIMASSVARGAKLLWIDTLHHTPLTVPTT